METAISMFGICDNLKICVRFGAFENRNINQVCQRAYLSNLTQKSDGRHVV